MGSFKLVGRMIQVRRESLRLLGCVERVSEGRSVEKKMCLRIPRKRKGMWEEMVEISNFRRGVNN
jgi:hypothetical protein